MTSTFDIDMEGLDTITIIKEYKKLHAEYNTQKTTQKEQKEEIDKLREEMKNSTDLISVRPKVACRVSRLAGVFAI